MSRSPSEETPESPDSPKSPPTPFTTTGSRLFAAVRSSMTPPEPSPSSTTDPTPSPNQPLDDAGADPSWSTDEPLLRTDPQPDSGGILSIGRSGKVSRAGLRTAIGGGLRRVCKLVAVLAADEEERAIGLWRADDEDVQDIAEPAASLIYRRLPDAARGSDAMDLFQLGLGLLGYLGKNIKLRGEIRTRRHLQDAYNITPEESQS